MMTLLDEHDFADEEWPEETGDEDDDLLACPSCRGGVHEDTQQCPHCGDWIVPAYPGGTWKTIWFAAAVLLIAAMMLITVL